jgi:spermidine/putrescine transport system ATP-binding protein
VDEPRKIYDYPATRFVADFIGTTNFMPGKIVSSGPEVASVDLDNLGVVCVPAQEGIESGQAVILAVRPERLRLEVSSGQAQTNQVEGVLEEVIFTGNDTQYLVRFKNGIKVLVREQNQSPSGQAASYQPGQSVHVHWSLDAANVLLD